jgi:hypothetical protein
MPDDGRMSDDVEGGDPVCWLALVCPECSAMPTEAPTGDSPDRCWRCGASLSADEEPG